MLNLGLNERFHNYLSLENCTQIYIPDLQLQRRKRWKAGGRKEDTAKTENIFYQGVPKELKYK